MAPAVTRVIANFRRSVPTFVALFAASLVAGCSVTPLPIPGTGLDGHQKSADADNHLGLDAGASMDSSYSADAGPAARDSQVGDGLIGDGQSGDSQSTISDSQSGDAQGGDAQSGDAQGGDAQTGDANAQSIDALAPTGG